MNKNILTLLLLTVLCLSEAYSQDRGRRDRNRGENRADRAENRAERRAQRAENRAERRAERAQRRAERRANRIDNRNQREERRRVNRTPHPRNTRTIDHGRRRPVHRDRTVISPRNPRRVTPPRRVVHRRVNRNRPDRRYYGSRSYHRPSGYRQRSYSRSFHIPINRTYVHRRRYQRPNLFFRYVRETNRGHLYLNWILAPSHRGNGYHLVNEYPYFVHNGYRHRYSNLDSCNYQLVDKNTHTIVRTYWNQSCYSGYNSCAVDRDRRNEMEWDFRYMCAETFRDQNYDFNFPTYDYEYEDYDEYGEYNDYNDYDDYNNDYRNSSGVCYDYDYEQEICYDRR